MYRLFLTTAWTGSNTPFEHELPNGETALVYQTLPQAYNAANDSGDIIQPAPPGTPGFCFYGSDGEPLQTVVVDLGANLSVAKSITFQGDWTILRFDGRIGGYGVCFNATSGATAIDCDFISGASNLNICSAASLAASRCRFANYRSSSSVLCGYASGNAQTYDDCLFVNCVSTHSTPMIMGTTTTARRCSIYACSRCIAACSDVVIVRPTSGTDPGIAPADTFVGSIPDDPSDVTDWSGAVDWDFRIKSTTTYATGGTSVTSGQKVYDLAGMPRKVGGAKGAYECLSDVDRWFCRSAPIWFRVTRDDDGPNVAVWRNSVGSNGARAVVTTRFACQIWNGSSWGAVAYYTANKTVGANETTRFANAPNNVITGGWTVVETSSVPIDGFSPVDIFTGNDNRNLSSWRAVPQLTTSASAFGTSVVYIDKNTAFRSNASSVAKVYVGNGARVDLGDANIGDLVVGLRSVVKTTGKVTLKNQTATSAEILSQLKPTAPAVVTFKECAISDQASE